jgi:hypothetical protein
MFLGFISLTLGGIYNVLDEDSEPFAWRNFHYSLLKAQKQLFEFPFISILPKLINFWCFTDKIWLFSINF